MCLPTEQQGIKVLGVPLDHHDFVRQHLSNVHEEHQPLLTRIPLLADVQSAWLLLVHCAQARANFLIRAINHARRLWWCLGQVLGTDLEQCEARMRDVATLALVLGGLGLRSAARTSQSAFWASWADAIPMVGARHPEVASQLVRHLEGNPDPPTLAAAEHAARAFSGILGFELPSWRSLLLGAGPTARAPDTFEPGTQRQGWQHEASSRTEESFRNVLFTRLPDSTKASVRSQGGPGAGLAFTTCPTCLVTRLEPQLFRVLLLRRLRLPLPLTVRSCWCGPPLRSMRASSGAWQTRVGFGECGARVWREAGGPGRDQRDVARPRHGFP